MSYEIMVCSDTEYEQLVAEIHFANGELVVVSQERSPDEFEVAIYSPFTGRGGLNERPSLLDLDVFIGAIAEAKERLKPRDITRY
jgi:hypothetical protein